MYPDWRRVILPVFEGLVKFIAATIRHKEQADQEEAVDAKKMKSAETGHQWHTVVRPALIPRVHNARTSGASIISPAIPS